MTEKDQLKSTLEATIEFEDTQQLKFKNLDKEVRILRQIN